MSSVIEVPDWYRTVALVGVDITGEPVVVLLDSTGAIMAVMKGEYAGTLKNIAVDASGRIVSVIRDPTSDNYIAIDANGYIAAVLKATYSGALKDVACDAEGRIIMIPTDPADIWGNAISMGNAEVVACLTPYKRYDRRGSVMFGDSFNEGIASWSTTISGTSAEVILSTTYSRTGAYSVKVAPGSVANNYARIFRYLPYAVLSKQGFEISFNYGASISTCGIWFRLFDGTNCYEGRLIFDLPNTKLVYYNSGGTYTNLATGLNIYTGLGLFHTLKLVMDWVNKKYVRGMFNEREVAMTDIAPYPWASNLAPHIEVYFNVISAGGALHACYVDDAIVTQGEPANV